MSRQREHGWFIAGSFLRLRHPGVRSAWIAGIASSAISTVLVLLSIGIVSYGFHAQEDRAARTPVFARPGDEPIAMIVLRGPIWQNEQFPMVWLQPTTPEAPPPPGLSEWPDPGEVVVSPGLMARTDILDAWGWEISDAGTGENGAIGDEGLITRSELLAYAVPPAGRSLGTLETVRTISGYGVSGGGSVGMAIETDQAFPAPGTAAVGVTAFLLVPGAILVAGGLRTRLPARRRRAHELWLLGVSRKNIRLAFLVEASAYTLPGIVIGAAAATLGLSFLTALPWTGWTVAPGALLPSSMLMLAGCAGVLLFAVLVAVFTGKVGAEGGDTRSRRNRLRSYGRFGRIAGPVVLVVTGVVLLAASRASSDWIALLLWLVLILLCATWPVVAATLIRWSGRSVERRSETIDGVLLGRQLGAGARSAAATLNPLAVMILLSGAALSTVAAAGAGDPAAQTESPRAQIAIATWRDPRPGDFELLVEELPTGQQAIPVDEEGVAHANSCEDAAEFVDLPASICKSKSDQPDALTSRWSTLVRAKLQVEPVYDWAATSRSAEVLLRATDRQGAYNVMFDHFVAPDVIFLGGVPSMARNVVKWLNAGAIGATIVLLCATLIRFGDLTLSTGMGVTRLKCAGIPADRARAVRVRASRVALLVTTLAAALYALLFSWAGQRAQLTAVSAGPVLIILVSVVLPAGLFLLLAQRYGKQ